MANTAVDNSKPLDDGGEIGSGQVTIVANTEDTVTFTNDIDVVEVLTDGADELWVSVDGRAATVNGKHCYPLPAAACSREIAVPGSNKVISLKSAGTPAYAVTKVS